LAQLLDPLVPDLSLILEPFDKKLAAKVSIVMSSENPAPLTGKKYLHKLFMWLVLNAGIVVCALSVYRLPIARIDLQFLLLALVTIVFGSRIGVKIPQINAEITVSDTFVFLILLLYGSQAAVLVAGLEALCSSMRFAKQWFTRFFNASLLAFSTFITASVLQLCFGSIAEKARASYSGSFIIALFLMASVQYVVNSGLAALRESMKHNRPFVVIWQKHFLWTSITYYAGASAAGIITRLITGLGFYAFIVALPIIGIIYATYRTYRRNIEEAEQHAKEQWRISQALQQSEEHFRNAFDHAAGMALISPDGQWRRVNSSLCQILGYSEEEMLATNFQEVTYADDLGNDLVHIYQLLEGKIRIDQREKRYVHKLGYPVWVLQSASAARNATGESSHLILQIQDITERKRAEEQVHHAAFHDALTSLPNRTFLSDRLSLALARAKRNKDYRFAVLFLDLDRFKMVNDSLGHTLGDQLLVELGRRLESCMRKADTVARLGGDEFGMLLDGIKDPYDAIHIAERIQEELMNPFELNGHEFLTTVSIGIAFSETGYDSPEDILRDADIAMYRAKANGKARYEVFDTAMHSHAVEMLTLERELRRAIERKEIHVQYQPIVSLQDQKLIGFEALARWHSAELGPISPAQFIPLAEETGLIIPLGMLVLNEACRLLRRWHELYPEEPKVTLSVNLSGKQFAQFSLVDQIKTVLRDTGLDAACLHLEVTESVIMDKAEDAAEMLLQLKKLGVKLSIDDFGTGYSSLSYLHRFPFDILKIDRSFVGRMGVDHESTGIVETILILAEKLGKKVVAEGVETLEQLAMLTAAGCAYGQGYLFARPLDADGAEALLLKERGAPMFAPGTGIDLATEVYSM
jgi:diguanylate cyclase (GGDEF)-like protein/PAS domain S-box-containing protein